MSLLPNLRYDMPATFGPSPVPDRTVVEDAAATVVTFGTTHDAARAIVPEYFDLPEFPSVSVSHVAYRGVDYLGGRGYNEIVVTIGAEYGASDQRLSAGYAAILWVDQIGALIAGREYMGLPKLLGEIPDLVVQENELSFSCSEYGTVLLEAHVDGLCPVPEDKLEKLNKRAGAVNTFGWKYIAAPGGVAHLDCPMLNVMRWSYDKAWTGQGSVQFLAPLKNEAPLSYQAVQILALLPQIGEARAFHGRGKATIDRSATRCL